MIRRLRNMSLIERLIVACCGILGAIICLSIYVEATDPCVQYADRGWVVYHLGGTSWVQPNRVCVARKSGWRE